MATSIPNQDSESEQENHTIEDENPISLDLTQAQFRRYVDVGVSPKDLHTAMHDATLMLPRMVAAANKVAQSDADMERVIRHFLLDCAERVLPIFEAHVLGNSGMRECIEAGRALANREIDQQAAEQILRSFVRSFEPQAIPDAPHFAAISAFFAVGWNWLEVDNATTDMLRHAAWAVRFSYNAGGQLRSDRNWIFERFLHATDELITESVFDAELDEDDLFEPPTRAH